MDNFMIGIVVLLCAMFGARTIHDKACKKLEDHKKAALIDLFSTNRTTSFVFLITLIIIFFLNIKFHWIDHGVAYFLYIALALGYFAVSSYLAYQKLKENQYDDSYIKAHILSTSIRLVGLMVFFVLVS